MFAIVHFLSDDTVDVIPTAWIIPDSDEKCCYCPPLPGTKLNKAVISCEPVNVNWPKENIRVFSKYGLFFNSFINFD